MKRYLNTIGLGLLIVSVLVIVGLSQSVNRGELQSHQDYQILISSLRGETAIVQTLLENGADPNTPPNENDKGMTALMFAAWKGHEDIVKLLLDAGADPNAVSSNEASPLMYAVGTGNENILDYLLEKGANPNYVSSEGQSVINFPLAKGQANIVKKLAAAMNIQVLNSLRISKQPIIIFAVNKGESDLIEAVLVDGLDLNIRDSEGNTALMLASRTGKTEIVSKLLRQGADVNARDSKGVTSLTKAVIGDQIDVIKVLRTYGAKP